MACPYSPLNDICHNYNMSRKKNLSMIIPYALPKYWGIEMKVLSTIFKYFNVACNSSYSEGTNSNDARYWVRENLLVMLQSQQDFYCKETVLDTLKISVEILCILHLQPLFFTFQNIKWFLLEILCYTITLSSERKRLVIW